MVCAALAGGSDREESRAHLGIKTQRQWSEQAIARTTPLLLGVFSLVTLLAHQFLQGQELPLRTAAEQADTIEMPRSLVEPLSETVAYAA
jgi:hypothetical protein